MDADTSNQFFVGVRNEELVIMNPLAGGPLSREQAVNLAAWLAVLADPTLGRFNQVVGEIKGT